MPRLPAAEPPRPREATCHRRGARERPGPEGVAPPPTCVSASPWLLCPQAPAPVRGGGGLPKGGKPGPSRPGGMASQMAQQKPLVKLPQKQPSPAKAKMNPTPRGKGFVWKNLWSPAQ